MILPDRSGLCLGRQLLEICDELPADGRGGPTSTPRNTAQPATEAHGEFDRNRDAVALGLVRPAWERGQPMFGICRGFQEINVALVARSARRFATCRDG